MISADPHAAPAARLAGLIDGFWCAQVINAAAQLRIADVLASGPQDCAVIAEKAGADPASVFRLMRALTTLGLCTQSDGFVFELTATGRLLRADDPNSMRGRAMHVGGMLWQAFGDLTTAVKLGRPAPNIVTGLTGFNEMAKDPAALATFHLAMAESSRRAAKSVLAVYDFERFGTLMDVGGGYGALLAAVLEASPRAQGVVCDLPFLEPGATQYLAKAGLANRARFVGGDFFKEIPGGAACYLLKFIIHDWDDEHALAILKNCRVAAGTLVLIEQVVPERVSDAPRDRDIIRADLSMMTYGGKERTASEYRKLLADAGLLMTKIVPTAGIFSLIEAVPAV